MFLDVLVLTVFRTLALITTSWLNPLKRLCLGTGQWARVVYFRHLVQFLQLQ